MGAQLLKWVSESVANCVLSFSFLLRLRSWKVEHKKGQKMFTVAESEGERKSRSSINQWHCSPSAISGNCEVTLVSNQSEHQQQFCSNQCVRGRLDDGAQCSVLLVNQSVCVYFLFFRSPSKNTHRQQQPQQTSERLVTLINKIDPPSWLAVHIFCVVITKQRQLFSSR